MNERGRSAAARLKVTDQDAPDLRRVLLRELAPMLHPPGPAPQPSWVCVTVQGPDDTPCGGLIGLAVGAWLTIDLVWLPVAMRGQGLGGRLLMEAERHALARGCMGAIVMTSSDPASRFYERNGYVTRLRLPDFHPGYTKITLQKTFE